MGKIQLLVKIILIITGIVLLAYAGLIAVKAATSSREGVLTVDQLRASPFENGKSVSVIGTVKSESTYGNYFYLIGENLEGAIPVYQAENVAVGDYVLIRGTVGKSYYYGDNTWTYAQITAKSVEKVTQLSSLVVLLVPISVIAGIILGFYITREERQMEVKEVPSIA